MYVVGQAPAMTGGNRSPLTGPASHRLSEMSGVTRKTWLLRTARLNVFDTWPGKSGKGDAFPLQAAREIVDDLLPRLQGRPVILLGGNVSAAFQYNHGPFEWHWHRFMWIARCPHPSGVNRWWNDSRNVAQAQRFWRSLFRRGKAPHDAWSRGRMMTG